MINIKAVIVGIVEEMKCISIQLRDVLIPYNLTEMVEIQLAGITSASSVGFTLRQFELRTLNLLTFITSRCANDIK